MSSGLSIDLSGRSAFVSGVTSGIGAGVAKTLATAGCNVAGCGRHSAESDAAQSFIESVEVADRKAFYVQGDLTDRATPRSLITETMDRFGKLDILVSNAGRNIFRGAENCEEEAWDECLNLDLAAHWRLSREAKPYLEASGDGVIVIIGSNHGWNTIPGCFPYNVAKAGLLGLVQSLAIEWGPKVRTVGIAPGFIDTIGNQTWFDSFANADAERARTEKLHPVRRLGTVEEIAATCAFVCSSFGGFMSGTTLCIDGGRSALMQDA